MKVEEKGSNDDTSAGTFELVPESNGAIQSFTQLSLNDILSLVLVFSVLVVDGQSIVEVILR